VSIDLYGSKYSPALTIKSYGNWRALGQLLNHLQVFIQIINATVAKLDNNIPLSQPGIGSG
jgi:hypothetical protein